MNGLKDTEKRSRVFRWLKSLNVHIICLQETNFDLSDQQLWEQQWGEQCIFNYFNAILVNSSDLQLSRQVEDMAISPRLLVARVSSTSNSFEPFSLGSVYIFAQSADRKLCINVLKEYPELSLDIFVGDCNIIANLILDHSLGSCTLVERDWPNFREVLQN